MFERAAGGVGEASRKPDSDGDFLLDLNRRSEGSKKGNNAPKHAMGFAAHVPSSGRQWSRAGQGGQIDAQPGLASRALPFASCASWAGFSTSLSLEGRQPGTTPPWAAWGVGQMKGSGAYHSPGRIRRHLCHLHRVREACSPAAGLEKSQENNI